METRRTGGMTEFLPTPSEKRDSLVRDHVFQLLLNLNERIHGLEKASNSDPSASRDFAKLMAQIRNEEENLRANFNNPAKD